MNIGNLQIEAMKTMLSGDRPVKCCVKLYNHGGARYHIKAGDKISQLVILPVLHPDLELVDSLDETERGDNGFGSTGR